MWGPASPARVESASSRAELMPQSDDESSPELDFTTLDRALTDVTGVQDLRERVLSTINRLIKKATEHHGVLPEEICNAVISGNTTMMHLLLGLNPEYIRLEPYTPTVLESMELTAILVR